MNMTINNNHKAMLDLDEVIRNKTHYLEEKSLDLIYNNPKNFMQWSNTWFYLLYDLITNYYSSPIFDIKLPYAFVVLEARPFSFVSLSSFNESEY